MKTFVPGAIASAADVNSNFAELAARAANLETATQDTGWQPTTGWTWGAGFAPSKIAFRSIPGMRWRRIGALVILDGGVQHTNANTDPAAAFQLPTDLRPLWGWVSGSWFFDPAAGGNVTASGIGQTDLEFVHIEWRVN